MDMCGEDFKALKNLTVYYTSVCGHHYTRYTYIKNHIAYVKSTQCFFIYISKLE